MKISGYSGTEDLGTLVKRPLHEALELEGKVQKVLDAVREKGDEALIDFTRKFDGVELDSLKYLQSEVKDYTNRVSAELREALQKAYNNIFTFHHSQKSDSQKIETMPGVVCWREDRAIEKVGLYIPGGTAPLVSTVLMLGVPARVAGCEEVVLCTPPDKGGKINPAILYAAELCGINNIYSVGGAQAIAGMAFGTESIPKVDKIFGPGNQYVTCAKMLVQRSGIAIDMPAGPSEVLVWCDDGANPSFVASDLLAQAEHGVDSQVMVVCESRHFATQIQEAVELQLSSLPRKEIAREVLKNSRIIIANAENAIEVINEYAPEHLIIQRKNLSQGINDIVNVGSVFLGPFTPESAGDYASGTNHTLPTNGYARTYSGVSLDSFVKKVTFQEISRSGLEGLEKVISPMAEAEELEAHKRAVLIRLGKVFE